MSFFNKGVHSCILKYFWKNMGEYINQPREIQLFKLIKLDSIWRVFVRFHTRSCWAADMYSSCVCCCTRHASVSTRTHWCLSWEMDNFYKYGLTSEATNVVLTWTKTRHFLLSKVDRLTHWLSQRLGVWSHFFQDLVGKRSALCYKESLQC